MSWRTVTAVAITLALAVTAVTLRTTGALTVAAPQHRTAVRTVAYTRNAAPGDTSATAAEQGSAGTASPATPTTVNTLATIEVPAPANAPRHCRAEIAPALLMNAFIPQGLRLGLNPCLRNWLAAGVITTGGLATIVSNYLPPPWNTMAGVIGDAINGSTDAISYLVNDACGYWAYLYVTWAPPLAWASCSPDAWGGWTH
nr:hypothetical protein [Streptomyces sp. SID5468]